MASNGPESLGLLLEAFVNRVSHPRGRALAFLLRAKVTVDQAILLDAAHRHPGATASSLAAVMSLSLPSTSQMIERLVKMGLLRRREDPSDRRRKSVEVTAKAKTFLARLQAVRAEEFATGTEGLSPATQRALREALRRSLDELTATAPKAA